MNPTENLPFHLYIGARAQEGGIYHYLYDGNAFVLLEKTQAPLPMYFFLTGDRLYSLLRAPFLDSSESGVRSWHLAPDGMINQPSPILPTCGECGCHLYVEDERIYVANYFSGNIALVPQGMIDQHVPVEGGSKVPHTHCIIPSPDGQFLLATDLGRDEITLYHRPLVPVSVSTLPVGSGPRHLCFSEDGRRLYCANELTSTISVFSYANGALTLTGTYGGIPERVRGTTAAAALRVRNGQVLLSHRGMDCIEIFDEMPDGTLAHRQYVDCCGRSPRDFVLNGQWMICMNELSDSVTCFLQNAAGEYSLQQTLTIPHPICAAVYSPLNAERAAAE